MKKLAFLSMMVAFGVQAQEIQQPTADLIVALAEVDKTSFCVYGNKIYSEGAAITMGKEDKVCKEVPGELPKRLTWQ